MAPETNNNNNKNKKRSETAGNILLRAGFILRIIVTALTLAPLIDMVTSKQTVIYDPFTLTAKFTYSPALLYYVVAMSVVCLYSVITVVILGLSASRKILPPAKLLFYLTVIDELMIGIVSSATGAATAVAYIGLRGNSHVGWSKICDMFGVFCRHVGSSVLVSVIAVVVLLLQVMISTYMLYIQAFQL